MQPNTVVREERFIKVGLY